MNYLWDFVDTGNLQSSYLYSDLGVKLGQTMDEDCSPCCPWFKQAPQDSQNPARVCHAPHGIRRLQLQQFPANSKTQWPQLCQHGRK